nr:MAG TPA: hypothetical protein [Caudoviricetes sp.]
MSDLSSFRSSGSKPWSAQLWDGLIDAMIARLAPLEEQLDIQRATVEAIIARGLTVIELEISPLIKTAGKIVTDAQADVDAKLELIETAVFTGMIIVTSITPASLSLGQTISLTVPPLERVHFVPTPYLALSRAGSIASWAIGEKLSWDAATGVLTVKLTQVTGAGGPFNDWVISSLPAATLIQQTLLNQAVAVDGTIKLRQADISAMHEAVFSWNSNVNIKHTQVMETAGENAANLAAFMRIYRGPLPSDPLDGAVGHFYFNTAQQVSKIFTSSGWAPLFSISLGGIRQGDVVATAGQTVFAASAFTFMNVWKNGVKLVPGTDVTFASPNFTVPSAATGDKISYLGYFATNLTDFYLKAQADARFVSVMPDQAFTDQEKEEARKNIGVNDATGKVPPSQLPPQTTTATVGAALAGANGVQTPADGDRFAGILAGASTVFHTTWGNIKAALSSLFLLKSGDTLTGTLMFGKGRIQTDGDIYAARADGNTGVIFLNAAGNRYLYYNGTAYTLSVDSLQVGGTVSAGAAFLNTDGNLNGAVWNAWGTGWAKDAIGSQMETRGQAWAQHAINSCIQRDRVTSAGFVGGDVGQPYMMYDGWSIEVLVSDRNLMGKIAAKTHVDELGVYALAQYYTGGGDNLGPNQHINGSQLKYASAFWGTGSTLPGTWQLHGHIKRSTGGELASQVSLVVRKY